MLVITAALVVGVHSMARYGPGVMQSFLDQVMHLAIELCVMDPSAIAFQLCLTYHTHFTQLPHPLHDLYCYCSFQVG